MSSWSVSVVIPTFNRRARLAKVLSALEAQTTQISELEVVVVDDGSTDQTSDWLSEARFAYKCLALKQANGGPAAARNAGVRAAANEFILFLDDDVVPEEDFVAEHLRSHRRAKGEVVVLGPMLSLPRYEQPWVAWEQFQLEKQYKAMERGEFEPTFRQFWTGNASVRRECLTRAGLFDVNLKRGEDVDLGLRLHELGLNYLFNPRARGFHYAERSLSSFCKAHSTYGEMEVELFEKQPGGAEDILAGNWQRLHPAQRRLLQALLESNAATACTHAALTTLLQSSLSTVLPSRINRAACSLLANMLFWKSSRAALGVERFSRLIKRTSSESPPGGEELPSRNHTA